MSPSKPPSIFDLMNEEEEAVSEEEERKKRRAELLEPTGIKEHYKDGKISINKFTCTGAQCKICIDKCPTHALYWGTGQVDIIEDMCVYCGACVANCMVDDCIKVERTLEDGTQEKFSNVHDVVKLQERKNTKRRLERVQNNAATLRRTYQGKKVPQPYKRNRRLYIDQEDKAV
jgi:ferredoxin